MLAQVFLELFFFFFFFSLQDSLSNPAVHCLIFVPPFYPQMKLSCQLNAVFGAMFISISVYILHWVMTPPETAFSLGNSGLIFVVVVVVVVVVVICVAYKWRVVVLLLDTVVVIIS